MSIRYVTPEEFTAIIRRQDEARALRKQARNPRLLLAEKVELLRQAKALDARNYSE